MKTQFSFFFFLFSFLLFSQSLPVSGNLNNLYMLSEAQTRSISPENFTGAPGRGGMATLENGSAANAARDLGQGWKVNPYVVIKPGETFTMAEMSGPGMINHIWMTPTGDYRLSIFRIYWDDESEPSVEVPVGDFFVSGWGWENEPDVRSLAVCVNPKNGFNCYWQMPFRKNCRISMENRSASNLIVYYQIDYSLVTIPDAAAYFHAQFRRVPKLKYKDVYTIVDGIKGNGHYVGTYLAHAAKSPGWWGEGEIKFYMDGDGEFPTVCGTGEEDYFCGSYGYEMREENGTETYTSFSSPYSGFHHIIDPSLRRQERRFGQYRWHITDPIRFKKDLRVTIQSIGWQSGGRYLPLEDDLASVAYWYQSEPHAPFPGLPADDQLILLSADPVDHLGKGRKIELGTAPSSKYQTHSGSLVDGILGSARYNDGMWMGFEGTDLEAVIDLGTSQKISSIRTSFLSDQNAWIFFPSEIRMAVSMDGTSFKTVSEFKQETMETNVPEIRSWEQDLPGMTARYVKVSARNTGTCPDWHKGAGDKAWMFVDEMIIQ